MGFNLGFGFDRLVRFGLSALLSAVLGGGCLVGTGCAVQMEGWRSDLTTPVPGLVLRAEVKTLDAKAVPVLFGKEFVLLKWQFSQERGLTVRPGRP